MKKSDTLTVLAGLVITGIGWRFGGPQWGIPLAIAAAATFLGTHLLEGKGLNKHATDTDNNR